MQTSNKYHRPDAVVGVGFLIDHCSRPVHSIAWPDRVGERMTEDELDRRQIVVETFVSNLGSELGSAKYEITTAVVEDTPSIAPGADVAVNDKPPAPVKKARKKRQG